MNRKPTNPSTDKEIYRRSASTGKAVNLGKVHFRGGTRL